MVSLGNSYTGKYSIDRPVEWILSGCMLWYGVVTLVKPSVFRGVGGLVPWSVFTVSALLFGILWVFALIRNGHGLPWTARVRWICSVVCSLILAFMALTNDLLDVGSHVMWTLGAMYSCLRAGIDAIGEIPNRTVNVAILADDGSNGRTGSTGSLSGTTRSVSDIAVVRRDNSGNNHRDEFVTLDESRDIQKQG